MGGGSKRRGRRSDALGLQDDSGEIGRLFGSFEGVGVGGEEGSAFGGGGRQWHEGLVFSEGLENKKPPG